MYIHELSIDTSSLEVERLPALAEKMGNLADSLYRHGHLAYGYVSAPFKNGKLSLLLNLVAPDSLDIEHRKSYVKFGWDEIETMTGQSLVLDWLGNEIPEEHWGGPVEPCGCSQSGYILDGERGYSPVLCLDCGHFVPIYTLPETSYGGLDEEAPGEGYDDIYFWRKSFTACDTLWFHGYAEALMAQMQMDYRSELSERGRKLTRRIEFLTGKITYYFLTDLIPQIDGDIEGEYTTYSQASKRLCPSCGQDWLLPDPLHMTYHFQCIACRLVSELPRGYTDDRVWSPSELS